MKYAQLFWDLYRERLEVNLLKLRPDQGEKWTLWRRESAVEACREFAKAIGIDPFRVSVRAIGHGGEVPVGGHKVDVTARDETGRNLVLFHSELGQPDSRDNDDWRTEFV